MKIVKNEIDLVVFDMAGTTVFDNHDVERCLRKAFDDCNIVAEDHELLRAQGWSKRDVFEYFLKRQHPKLNEFELNERIESAYSVFKGVLEGHYRRADIKPTEGCLEFLSFLKEYNIKTALTTGFYRRVADIILEKLGWLDNLNDNYIGNESSLIGFSVTSDQVKSGRPQPDMIFKSMAALGVSDANKVVNVGDTPSDLKSGIAAGCKFSLGLTNGTHSEEQLAKFENHGLYSGLFELCDDLFGVVPVAE